MWRAVDAPSLADLVDASASVSPTSPPYGTTIVQPDAPNPTPVGPVLLTDGTTLPPPNDQPV